MQSWLKENWQQVQIKIGELKIGGRDNHGIFWIVENIENYSSIKLVGEVEQRAWTDGGWVSPQFYGPKRFTLTVGIRVPPTHPHLVNDSVELLISQLPKKDLGRLMVRNQRETTSVSVICEDEITVKKTRISARVTIPFVAPDPYKVKTDWETGEPDWKEYETGLANSTGGVTFPLKFEPLIFDGESLSGDIAFTVNGTAPPVGIIEIAGPVNRPSLEDSETGWRCWFDIELTEGETLVINPVSRQVLLNGTASRRGLMVGSWPDLRPGVHWISWNAEKYEENARLRIVFAETFV